MERGGQQDSRLPALPSSQQVAEMANAKFKRDLKANGASGTHSAMLRRRGRCARGLSRCGRPTLGNRELAVAVEVEF